MFDGTLLIGGIEEILGILVPIIFVFIYLLNQLLTAKVDPKQHGRGPQRQPPAERPMRPAQGERQPQRGTAQLNTEIEQFLKRASQRRGQQPARDRAARSPAAPKAPPKAPPRPPREAPRQKPRDVAPIEEGSREDVAASVQKHMGAGKFKEWVDHLGDDVSHSDEQMEEHLQQVFHHRLGTLGGETADASTEGADVQTMVITDAPSAAAAFAQLLRTPEGMRQAIVVSEILARPDVRW